MENDKRIFQNLPIAFAKIVQRWEKYGSKVMERARSFESQVDDVGLIKIEEVMETTGIRNPSRARALMTSLGGFSPSGGKYEEAVEWEFNPHQL